MKYLVKFIKPVFVLLFAASLVSFHGCSGKAAINEKIFVGKWKSSKLETPVYLYANGEWEIKLDEGGVLQYGVWEYKNNKIIWSYKIGPAIGHDADPVLSATAQEFQLQENDKTTTTFKRLD